MLLALKAVALIFIQPDTSLYAVLDKAVIRWLGLKPSQVSQAPEVFYAATDNMLAGYMIIDQWIGSGYSRHVARRSPFISARKG